MNCQTRPSVSCQRFIRLILLIALPVCLPVLTFGQPTYDGYLLPELPGGASRVHTMTADAWVKPVLAGESAIDAETWRACIYAWDWNSGAYAITALPVLDESRDSRVNAIRRDFLVDHPHGRLLAAGAAYDTNGTLQPIVWIKSGASAWIMEPLQSLTGIDGESSDSVVLEGEGSEMVYRACGWTIDGNGIKKAVLWERPESGGAWNLTFLPDNGPLLQSAAGLLGEEGGDPVGEEGDDIVAAGQVENLSSTMVPAAWMWDGEQIVLQELPLLDGGQTGMPLAIGVGFGGGDVGPAPLLAGWSEVAGGEHKPARWLYDEGEHMWLVSEMPTMVGYPEALINSFGGGDVGPAPLLIGTSSDPLGESKATLWWGEDLTFLVDFLEANIVNQTWDLSSGSAGDRQGRIGAHGLLASAKTGPPHAILAVPSPAVPTDLYVDPYATGPAHDGLSWCTAYLRLSEALSVAVAGTTIRVADGVQIPDVSGLADPRDATFRLLNDVTIEGGYAGCGAAWPDERNPMVFRTVLSGDLLMDDHTGGSNAENSYHVLTGSNTGPTAVLDGVIVTGGNADGSTAGIRDHGGGLFNDHGSPTIQNCLFRRNRSTTSGGGMCNRNYSSPVVTGCVFRQNESNGGGGMMNFAASNPRVTRCEFIQNTAAGGGGVLNNGAAPMLVDCLFYENQAGYGGGLRNYVSGFTVVINCAFFGNTANVDGGGVFNYGGTATPFVNCLFSGNSAINGGAMGNTAFASPILSNCTIAHNTALASGGGLFQSSLTGGSPEVRNSILWGNSDAGGTDVTAQIHTIAGTPQVDWSCVMGTWTGAGSDNIDLDPLFVDHDGADGIVGTPDDDLELGTGSSCIDNGNDTLVPEDSADLDEDLDTAERTPVDLAYRLRFLDDTGTADAGVTDPPDYLLTVDRGCYEFEGASPPVVVHEIFPELGGDVSYVMASVQVGSILYAAGWSGGSDDLRRPVLWDDSTPGWQLSELPTSDQGGEAFGLARSSSSAPPAVFGTRFDLVGLPQPAVWRNDGSGFLLELLPASDTVTGRAASGLFVDNGALRVIGSVLQGDGVSSAIVWACDEPGVWTSETLPGLGVGLSANGNRIAENPMTEGLVIGGWAEDPTGSRVPLVWITAPEPEPGWDLEIFDTLGGEGAVNGIVFDDEGADLAAVGWCSDGTGNTLAVAWVEDGGDMVLHTLPTLPDYQNGEALVGHFQGGGTVCILGRSYNGATESQATRWTLDASGGVIAENLNRLDNDFPLDGQIATDFVANFNNEITTIVANGVYQGAGMSVIEPHAYMFRYLSVVTGAREPEQVPPLKAASLRVHPNPFNPSTTISFELREPGHVRISIYDLLGRRVALLLDGMVSSTRGSVVWNGLDDAGRSVSSSAYLVRLMSSDGVAIRKVLLVK